MVGLALLPLMARRVDVSAGVLVCLMAVLVAMNRQLLHLTPSVGWTFQQLEAGGRAVWALLTLQSPAVDVDYRQLLVPLRLLWLSLVPGLAWIAWRWQAQTWALGLWWLVAVLVVRTVILTPGSALEASDVREGDELSLKEIDTFAGFTYCAAQMALQRAQAELAQHTAAAAARHKNGQNKIGA